MSLTLGHGPLARRPASHNFRIDGPAHRLHFEPHPRRVRAQLSGRTVLDTTRGALLHETGMHPVLYAPIEDLDTALLERTDHQTHCQFKGAASYWSVRAGDTLAENAVWAYEEPLEGAPWLAGLAALYWDRMDRWLEEDDEVFGHLRDPYHRADARPSSRSVEVRSDDGTLVLREESPILLFETGLGVRAYVSPERLDLEPSATSSVCAYKGAATYWSLRVGDRLLEDAAWSYEQPLDGMQAIAGRVSLDHKALEVSIEGA
jgi:uncharacterized protein (DUF427 family)